MLEVWLDGDDELDLVVVNLTGYVGYASGNLSVEYIYWLFHEQHGPSLKPDDQFLPDLTLP